MLVLIALAVQTQMPAPLKDFADDLLYGKGRMLTFQVVSSEGSSNKIAPYKVTLIASEGRIREESNSGVAIWDGTRGIHINKTATPTYWSTDARSKVFDADMPVAHTLYGSWEGSSWEQRGGGAGLAVTTYEGKTVYRWEFDTDGRFKKLNIGQGLLTKQPKEWVVFVLVSAQNYEPLATTFSTDPPVGMKEMNVP